MLSACPLNLSKSPIRARVRPKWRIAMKWTQEQGIAFESARECITALMAIFTADLVQAEAEHGPDSRQALAINAEITTLFKERSALTPTDVEGVARTLAAYAPLVREGLAERRNKQLLAA
jgi:hypothetical protein